MGFGELNRDLREVKNVPWQLTAVILAVFFGVPGTFLGTWGMLDAKGQGSSILAAMVAVPGYFMLLWGALGMRSRLKIAAANGEPVKPIRDKMLCGSAIFLVGLPLLAALSVGRVPPW